MTKKVSYSAPELHTYMDRSLEDEHHTRILRNILDYYTCSPGDRILEIGAGSGRYTELLLRLGFHVCAVEPDEYMARSLQSRLPDHPNLELHVGTVDDISDFPSDIKAVCGFHVLHHIENEGLQKLGQLIGNLFSDHPTLETFFFLEPNPYNPLFPLQVLLTPAMKFSEEKLIWTRRLHSFFEVPGGQQERHFIGYFPPGAVSENVPENFATSGTGLSSRSSIARIYALYGGRAVERPQ